MSTFEPPGYPDSRPVFPQELFDKLVDLVEVDSSRRPVLLNFSLVSKAWAHRSCKRIFSQVTLTTKTAFERWCKNTAPGPGGPSSLVQVLIFSQLKEDLWIHPRVLLGRSPIVLHRPQGLRGDQHSYDLLQGQDVALSMLPRHRAGPSLRSATPREGHPANPNSTYPTTPHNANSGCRILL